MTVATFRPDWRRDPRGAFDLEQTATGRGTIALTIGGQVHRVYRNANLSVYSAQRCNARCPFCIEELRPASRGLELVEQKRIESDDSIYFERLGRALEVTRPVQPSVSITGGEPSKDPRLPRIAELLAQLRIRKRTMTTNASGLLDRSDDGRDVLDRVLTAGLDHLNISRAAPEFARNQRIMRTADPLPDPAWVEVVERCRAAGTRVRLSCVLLRGVTESLADCERYLAWAASLGVDNVIFRQLMHYAADTVQPNYVTRYSDGWRAPMAPILEAIRPSDTSVAGHPRFSFIRQVLGYYYAVEVYRYEGPRGPMNVCIEGADLADIERDRRRRDDAVIHELVFHPDASLCSTWQPWDGRIL